MKNEEIVDSLKVIKCQHVSLEVSNVDVSLKFYRDFLGLKLSERHYANENPAHRPMCCHLCLASSQWFPNSLHCRHTCTSTGGKE